LKSSKKKPFRFIFELFRLQTSGRQTGSGRPVGADEIGVVEAGEEPDPEKSVSSVKSVSKYAMCDGCDVFVCDVLVSSRLCACDDGYG